MKITRNQKELLQHMLGAWRFDLKKDWGYRNHFFSDRGSKDHGELLLMTKLGLVTKGERLGSMVFWATKKGAVAIGFKPYQLRNTKLTK